MQCDDGQGTVRQDDMISKSCCSCEFGPAFRSQTAVKKCLDWSLGFSNATSDGLKRQAASGGQRTSRRSLSQGTILPLLSTATEFGHNGDLQGSKPSVILKSGRTKKGGVCPGENTRPPVLMLSTLRVLFHVVFSRVRRRQWHQIGVSTVFIEESRIAVDNVGS